MGCKEGKGFPFCVAAGTGEKNDVKKDYPPYGK